MREDDQLALRPPTSGVIVGALVDAIGQRPASLTNKQASRYFHGDPSVSPEERRRIFEAFAEWVVDLDLLPVPHKDREPTPRLSRLLAMALRWHADRWDSLNAYVYARAGRVFDPATALEPYLRLATLDLALRAASLLWMAGSDSPSPQIPPWGKAEGVGKWLNSLRTEARVTRDTLAEAAGVAFQSADDWFDRGARPEEGRFSGIAEALSPGLGHDDPAKLTVQLRRAYVLSAACDRLASIVGRPLVEMLAGSLATFTHWGLIALQPAAVSPGDGRSGDEDPTEVAAEVAMSLFLTGSSSPLAPELLRLFWEGQGDAHWRLAAQAAGLDWCSYIELKLAAASSGELAGPTIGMGHATREAMDMLLDLGAGSIDALANRDPLRAIAALAKRRAVLEAVLATSPGDAWLHMQFGAMEGKFGDAHRGIQECWNAALLEDGWELPLVEIGIIYLNSGEPAEARDHLERVLAERENPSWHLLYNLGVARCRCHDIGGALDALKKAIVLNPFHGDMLDVAAHCAFLLRDHVTGRHFMKRARLPGASSTYDRWQRKEYRKKR